MFQSRPPRTRHHQLTRHGHGETGRHDEYERRMPVPPPASTPPRVTGPIPARPYPPRWPMSCWQTVQTDSTTSIWPLRGAPRSRLSATRSGRSNTCRPPATLRPSTPRQPVPRWPGTSSSRPSLSRHLLQVESHDLAANASAKRTLDPKAIEGGLRRDAFGPRSP